MDAEGYPELWQLILTWLRKDPTITACVRVCRKWRTILRSNAPNNPGKVGSRMIMYEYYDLLAWAIKCGMPTVSSLIAAAALHRKRYDLHDWLTGRILVCHAPLNFKLSMYCPIWDITYECARVMTGHYIRQCVLDNMSDMNLFTLYIHALLSDETSEQFWLTIFNYLYKLPKFLIPAIKLKKWEVIKIIYGEQQYVEEVFYLIRSDYPYWNSIAGFKDCRFGGAYITYALELGKPEIAKLFGDYPPYDAKNYRGMVNGLNDDISEYKIAWL